MIYDEALENRGFQRRLEYVHPVNSELKGQNFTLGRSSGSRIHGLIKVGDTNNNHSNRRGRDRKVIQFNQPFCKLTNINIGKYFRNLLDRNFNRDNPLSKRFRRNI